MVLQQPPRHKNAFGIASEEPEYLGGLYRTATNGGSITNLSTGGVSSELTGNLEDVALLTERVLYVLGAHFAGIDIARLTDGSLSVIEANICADVNQDILEKSGVNILSKVVDLAEVMALRKKLKNVDSPSM